MESPSNETLVIPQIISNLIKNHQHGNTDVNQSDLASFFSRNTDDQTKVQFYSGINQFQNLKPAFTQSSIYLVSHLANTYLIVKFYQNVTRLCSARKWLTAFIQLLQLQVIQGTMNRFFLGDKHPDLNKCTWVGRHRECLSQVMQGPKLASCSSFCPGFSPYTYCSYLFHPSFQIFSAHFLLDLLVCLRAMRERSKVTQRSFKGSSVPWTVWVHNGQAWQRSPSMKKEIKISKEDIGSFFWTGRLPCLQTEETMSLVSLEFYWGFPLIREYFTYWTNATSEPSSLGNAYSKTETPHWKLQAWHCPKVPAVLPLLGGTQL